MRDWDTEMAFWALLNLSAIVAVGGMTAAVHGETAFALVWGATSVIVLLAAEVARRD